MYINPLRKTGTWAEYIRSGFPHCLVRGAFKHVLLTPETACEAADRFEAEATRRAAEADALWAQRDAALKGLGVLDLMAVKNPVAAVQHEARRAANDI